MYTHPETNPHIDTHISSHPPPLFSEAGLAGGDLLLLRGFPGCLINYPAPIVYQEAGEEQRRLKMATVRWRDPFPCQCWGWTDGRVVGGLQAQSGRERQSGRGGGACVERKREEHCSLAAGMIWHYNAVTVVSICDPLVSISECSNFSEQMLSGLRYNKNT